MIIDIENPISFKCPEGTYRGVLREITYPITSIGKKVVRLIFNVDVPTMRNYDVRVGISLPSGSKLTGETKQFLETWLGEQLIAFKGQPMEALIGKTADITTWHGPQKDGHDFPFVNFRAFAPGTKLSPREQFKQQGEAI